MDGRIIPDIVSGQAIVDLPDTASAREAARLMTHHRIGAIVVSNDGHLLGIVTERDLMARVMAVGLDPDTTTLAMIMTRNPDTLEPGDSVLDALELMQARGYRHLPVTDAGRVVGMVSVRDLYKAVRNGLEHDLREREAYIFGEAYGAST